MSFLETTPYADRLTMMFKRLCAAALLVLAASPFTAPFQTYDLAATNEVGAAFLVVVSEPAADAAYDSLLEPCFRHSGRWRIALAALADSQFPGIGAATFHGTIFQQQPATPAAVQFAARFFNCKSSRAT
jgi:hypothetical protein